MRDVLGEPAWAVVGPRVEAALAGHLKEYQEKGPVWIRKRKTPLTADHNRPVGNALRGVPLE
ncbi:MAG: hypothetical protein K2X38_12155 [Gemmataceae bacterium]|nr:hypothetical protein [Gemmataceae bacterium]